MALIKLYCTSVLYSSTMPLLRCRLIVSLLRSSIRIIRGACSHSGFPVRTPPVDLVRVEASCTSTKLTILTCLNKQYCLFILSCFLYFLTLISCCLLVLRFLTSVLSHVVALVPQVTKCGSEYLRAGTPVSHPIHAPTPLHLLPHPPTYLFAFCSLVGAAACQFDHVNRQVHNNFIIIS